MKPQPAKFTKDNPVTKFELWRCFKRSPHNGFATVQVDEAHSIIGLNAPRYMERSGYLFRETRGQGEFYTLTQTGEEWLTRGILAYAKNHPQRATEIPFLPGVTTSRRRVRRRR